MRFLLINYEFPPLGGGAGKATAALAREMAQQGHIVRVLTGRLGALASEEEIDGYTVIRIRTLRRQLDRSNPKELFLFMLAALPAALREGLSHRPDLSIAFFGIPSGPAAFLLRFLFRIPYIVSLRGLDVPGFRVNPRLSFYNQVMRLPVRMLWSWASAVVANSYGLRKLAHETAPKQEIAVIPNGVNPDQFRPRTHDVRHDKPYLLFVGRLVKQKGLAYLFQALRLVDVPYHLWIVGDGNERSTLESTVIEMGLKEHISFFGWLPHEEVESFYHDADIFVLPSEAEGMPNVVLEAMACGLPIIATQVTGTEDLIRTGCNGVLVPPHNPSALAEGLTLLLADPELRTRLGKAGLETIKAHSWKACAEQYGNLAEDILRH